MSLTTYKIIHLIGIFLVLSGIGGIWALMASRAAQSSPTLRRLLMTGHGLAMVLILIGGFGMLARLGIHGGWPAWIWIKLGIWLLVAVWPVVLRRIGSPAPVLFYLAPLLATIAAWAAVFHIGAG